MSYAVTTTVAVDKTRTEIETVLRRFGTTGFAYGWDHERAVIGFTMTDRQIRMQLALPDRGARAFTHTPMKNLRRSPDETTKAWETACRSPWRELLLVIKAKLMAVRAGIVTFEEEWLSYTVLPGGATVGDHALPAVAQAYETGQVPQLLPGPVRALEG